MNILDVLTLLCISYSTLNILEAYLMENDYLSSYQKLTFSGVKIFWKMKASEEASEDSCKQYMCGTTLVLYLYEDTILHVY